MLICPECQKEFPESVFDGGCDECLRNGKWVPLQHKELRMPIKTMAERKALDTHIEPLPPTMEISQNELATVRFFLGMAYEFMPDYSYAAYGKSLENLYQRINRGRPITELYKRS